MEILEKYGGWPVIKGNDWKFDEWNWLDVRNQISNDGLLDLILAMSLSLDQKNSTKLVLTVSTHIHAYFCCCSQELARQ